MAWLGKSIALERQSAPSARANGTANSENTLMRLPPYAARRPVSGSPAIWRKSAGVDGWVTTTGLASKCGAAGATNAIPFESLADL
jgi:hypothetical protein